MTPGLQTTAGKFAKTRGVELGVDEGQLRAWLVVLLLVLVAIASALGVIYSSYQSRQLFSELQQLDRQAVQLDEEWGRLLLEQSTWASHSRIEQLAKSKLNMVVPDASSTIVVGL